jgi:hypothetical protein
MRGKYRLLLVAGITTVSTLGVAAGIRSWTLSNGQGVGDLLARAEAAVPIPSEGDTVRIVTEVFEDQPEDPLKDPYHRDPLSLVPEYSIVSKTQQLGPDNTVVLSDVRQYLKDGQLFQQVLTREREQFVFWATKNELWRDQLPDAVSYEPPINIESLLSSTSLEISGEEKIDGQVATVLSGRRGDRLVEIAIREDGIPAAHRVYRNAADGSWVLAFERKLVSYEVNPALSAEEFELAGGADLILSRPDRAGDQGFSMPPDEQVSISLAREQAGFNFRVFPTITSATTYRGSRPPISWDQLAGDQRSIQHATSISHAYRTVGLLDGANVIVVQGPRDELTDILRSGPALWDDSIYEEIETVAGTAEAWMGTREDDGTVALVATIGADLLVIGAEEPTTFESLIEVLRTMR